MPQGKQAKLITEKQEGIILSNLGLNRYPTRDRVMFLLSIKAGLRAKEIAALTWTMVTDPGGNISDTIELPYQASKGKGGGRSIPMHPVLRKMLNALKEERGKMALPDAPVIFSERGYTTRGMSANSVSVWFHRMYSDRGFDGCSSHSGRRTFITRAARKIGEAGGSIRDVQELAGHSSLGTTQRYIQGSTDAKKSVIAMI